MTHVRKPHPLAYTSVLKSLAVEPQDALFVGDGGSDELRGAVRVGMDALHINDLDPANGEVLRVGVVDWDGPMVTNMSDVSGFVMKHG